MNDPDNIGSQASEDLNEAVKKLVQILKQDKSRKQDVIVDLAEIGKRSPEAIKPLLSEEDENIRAAGVMALSLTGEVEPVIESLKDESAVVRLAAKNALSISDSFEKLIDALKSDDWRVRYGVSAALEEASERAVKPLLKAFLKEQDNLIRSILLRIVQKSPESFIEFLAEFNEVRLPAMEILLESGNLEFLSGLMKHKEKRIREAAIVMLSILSDDAKIFVEALKDDSWFVRLIAAETIGRKGEQKHLKHLKKLLGDVDIVRETVRDVVETGEF